MHKINNNDKDDTTNDDDDDDDDDNDDDDFIMLYTFSFRQNMTVTETDTDVCEKCKALAAAFDLPPWLWDSTLDVSSGPRNHTSWCRRRAQYEAYKLVSVISRRRF